MAFLELYASAVTKNMLLLLAERVFRLTFLMSMSDQAINSLLGSG